MVIATLQRNHRKGKAVTGTLTLPFSETRIITLPTLENADFIIPAGLYPLDNTFSPKFKKVMPIIENVPEREGIRIHGGSRPEHSTGCVLVPLQDVSDVRIFIDKVKYRDEDEPMIQIKD